MSIYTIHEHSHRFAVWAAGRAYSRGGEGGGYTVANAKMMLEAAGLRKVRSVDDLPKLEQIDAFVDSLIQAVIAARPATYTYTFPRKKGEPVKRVERPFVCTYGRAQKLVNIYIKSKIICGAGAQSSDERLKKLHPPLDRQLLDGLERLGPGALEATLYAKFREKWATARTMGTSWTDFNKPTYDAYIAAIRALQEGMPLWAVEEHWMKNASGADLE
jgi:hypothetical protein